MQFKGFTQHDFDTFNIDGLDARMQAIQDRIQPKFKAIGETLSDDLAILAGNEMFLHIAKHARRTVNPPKDTWLAISHDKRGYKKHAHFQVGVFDDHVFLWLAFIYELPNKTEIAKKFLNHMDTIKSTIPDDYVISLDHMKKDSISMESLGEQGLEKALVRFRDIKKVEFLIGRRIMSHDPTLTNGNEFLGIAKNTFETLMPLYKLSFK